MLFVPAKSTSSQSGQLSGVPSFHPPPLPHDVPVRSPLIAPLGAYPALKIDDATAVAPFAAAATLMRVDCGDDTVMCATAEDADVPTRSVATAVTSCGPTATLLQVPPYGA